MTIASEINAAFQEIEGDFGDTFTLTGSTTVYPCRASVVKRGGDPMEGGLWPSYDATITVRRNLFATIPQAKQTLTHDGTLMYILSVNGQANQPLINLTVKSGKPPMV